MNDISWAAIGRYPAMSKMGGCDLMKSVQEIKDAILYTINYVPSYWIVFEGMMISTIKTTFYDYLMGLHNTNPQGIVPCFVVMKATLDGCITRIMGRGTMKPGLNLHNINSKNEQVYRHALTYNQKFVRYLNIEDLTLETMLPTFLKLVGDKQLLEQL
jgi:hypothetical protein